MDGQNDLYDLSKIRPLKNRKALADNTKKFDSHDCIYKNCPWAEECIKSLKVVTKLVPIRYWQNVCEYNFTEYWSKTKARRFWKKKRREYRKAADWTDQKLEAQIRFWYGNWDPFKNPSKAVNDLKVPPIFREPASKQWIPQLKYLTAGAIWMHLCRRQLLKFENWKRVAPQKQLAIQIGFGILLRSARVHKQAVRIALNLRPRDLLWDDIRAKCTKPHESLQRKAFLIYCLSKIHQWTQSVAGGYYVRMPWSKFLEVGTIESNLVRESGFSFETLVKRLGVKHDFSENPICRRANWEDIHPIFRDFF